MSTGRLNAYEAGRELLVAKARSSLQLTESQARLAVDLHLDPSLFVMNGIDRYDRIKQAIRANAGRDEVVSLMAFEDPSTGLGLFRMHCRNFVNRRQGISDINKGSSDASKAPKILRLLDQLEGDEWQGFIEVSTLARKYRRLAAADRSLFSPDDERSFQLAEQLGEDLRYAKPQEIKGRMLQGWQKTLPGIADGVRYFKRFEFDAQRFHQHVRQKLESFGGTEALVADYRKSIYQVGEAIASNFFADLGYPAFSKPDTHVTKVVESLVGRDMKPAEIFNYVSAISQRCGVFPRQLDKIFFLTGSGSLYLTGWVLTGDSKSRRQDLINVIKPLTR